MKRKLAILFTLALTLLFTLAFSSCDTTQTEHVCKAENWVVTKEPTCTERGESQGYCSCGQLVVRKKFIDELGHTEGEWVEKPATCTSYGSKYKKCTVCDSVIESETYPALGHTPKWTVIVEPTCTSTGTETGECTTCGEDLGSKTIRALGHSEGEWIVDSEPTCLNEGSKHTVCSVCKKTISTITIEALGHNVNEWKPYIEATCEENGKETGTCTVCYENVEKDISALGHVIEYSVKMVASCTSKGYKEGTCQRCGKQEIIVDEKLDHSMTEATCTSPKQCRNCDYYEGSILGHTSTTSACSRCGYNSYHSHTNVVGYCGICGDDFYDDFAQLIKSKGTSGSGGYEYVIFTNKDTYNESIVYWLNNYGTITIEFMLLNFESSNHTMTNIEAAHKVVLYLSSGAYSYELVTASAGELTMSGVISKSSFTSSTSTVPYSSCVQTYPTGETTTPSSSIISQTRESVASSMKIMLRTSQSKLEALGTDYNMGNFGYQYTQVVYATQGTCSTHDFEYMGTDQTCTYGGYKYYVCSICNYAKTEYVSSAGHNFSISCTIKSSTCTETGTKYEECIYCDYSKTTTISKKPHNNVEIDGEKGYQTYQCIDCEEIIKKTISYTIDYDLQGGTATNKEEYNVETNSFTLVNPTKTGYTFVGWSGTGIDGTSLNVTIEKGSVGDKNYKANWEIDYNNYTIIDGNIYSKDTKTFIKYNLEKTETTFTIPNNVTSIGERAFEGCDSLISVTIPDGIISIGDYAFCNCTSLTSITIPDSLTSIGYNAFYNCVSLVYNNEYDEAYYLGNEKNPYVLLIKINGYMTNYTINENTKIVYSDAFGDCTSLESITIPDSVIFIGDDAFWGCESLAEVHISDIASWCNISFASSWSSPVYFAEKLFINGELVTDLVIPNTIIEIKDYAFFWCASLTSIIIPDSVTSIGYEAFACTSITSVTIPDSVTTIGGSAFSCCASLISVTIPDSVTTIGKGAFDNCDSLTIYCEATSKPNGWDSNWNCSYCPIVWDCNNNEIADDGYIYTTIEGIVYGIKDNTATVVKQQKNIKSANILGSINYKGQEYPVTIIEDSAFFECNLLTSAKIPDSVISIGAHAFYYCESLKSIAISNRVTSIGKCAFYHCTSLTSVIIPDSVMLMGECAFIGGNTLTIYCEATSQPGGWDSNWNYDIWNDSNCSVIWGYKA